MTNENPMSEPTEVEKANAQLVKMHVMLEQLKEQIDDAHHHRLLHLRVDSQELKGVLFWARSITDDGVATPRMIEELRAALAGFDRVFQQRFASLTLLSQPAHSPRSDRDKP